MGGLTETITKSFNMLHEDNFTPLQESLYFPLICLDWNANEKILLLDSRGIYISADCIRCILCYHDNLLLAVIRH